MGVGEDANQLIDSDKLNSYASIIWFRSTGLVFISTISALPTSSPMRNAIVYRKERQDSKSFDLWNVDYNSDNQLIIKALSLQKLTANNTFMARDFGSKLRSPVAAEILKLTSSPHSSSILLSA